MVDCTAFSNVEQISSGMLLLAGYPCYIQHTPKAVAISVSTATDALADRRRQASALGWMIDEPAGERGSLVRRTEIMHRVAIVTKDGPVVLSILGKHTPTDCRDFEAAHHVSITVGATD